jgi:hypothetical protein
MPNTQSSFVSVVIVLTAAVTILLGYGLGRTHGSWILVRNARREVPKLRRIAWGRTRGVAGGVVLMLVVVVTAATDLIR